MFRTTASGATSTVCGIAHSFIRTERMKTCTALSAIRQNGLWKDGKDACVFGDTVPDDWPLELIDDRKTWPEDE